MNRITEILNELTEINSKKANINTILKQLENRIQEVTIEWQGLCTHPKEYITDTEDGEVKCSACGFTIEGVEE
jgi:hypothetical protein